MNKIILILIFLVIMLNGAGENIHTFKAEFTQSVLNSEEKGISYQGTIEAKIPDLAKWIYTKPLKKIIFINGKKVTIYEPNLYQATISHLKHNTDFISILKSAKLGEDGKYHSKIGDITYNLTMKNNKPYLIDFKDDLDNEIQIKFHNVLINKPIDNSDFEFIPNDDIDIIKH